MKKIVISEGQFNKLKINKIYSNNEVSNNEFEFVLTINNEEAGVVAYTIFNSFDNFYQEHLEDVIENEDNINIINKTPIAIIDFLTISDEYRGYGYGNELLQKAIIEIRKLGVKVLYLIADPSDEGVELNRLIQFYSKNGFSILEKHNDKCLMFIKF